MDTVAELLARGREREGTAIEAPDRAAPYSYREFSTNAWKAANLLHHYGVRADATVGVLVGPKTPAPADGPGRLGTAPEPLLAMFGAAILGATADLTPAEPVDARAIVLPSAWTDDVEVQPGCSLLAYGGPPEAPDVSHFERELWSENPVEPPESAGPDAVAVRIDGETYTQGTLLAAARTVADEHDLGEGDAVALDAPLTAVGALVAGVIAPLSVGATIRLGDWTRMDEEPVAYVVRSADRADASVPVVEPGSVTL